MMRWLMLMLMLLGFMGLPGCALHQAAESMTALPASLGKSAEAATKMILDQGVMDRFMVNAEGDFTLPGVQVSSGILFVSTARLVGVTGRIESSMDGTGTQLPKDVRAALIEQLSMPISDEQRAGILTTLGWNRVPSEHNPPP